jgi:hypothetical protein
LAHRPIPALRVRAPGPRHGLAQDSTSLIGLCSLKQRRNKKTNNDLFLWCSSAPACQASSWAWARKDSRPPGPHVGPFIDNHSSASNSRAQSPANKTRRRGCRNNPSTHNSFASLAPLCATTTAQGRSHNRWAVPPRPLEGALDHGCRRCHRGPPHRCAHPSVGGCATVERLHGGTPPRACTGGMPHGGVTPSTRRRRLDFYQRGDKSIHGQQ